MPFEITSSINWANQPLVILQQIAIFVYAVLEKELKKDSSYKYYVSYEKQEYY